MSIKQKAIDGVKWTSLSSILVAILQLLQISVLARYLAPEDFGLMALATVVIGFSRIFSDMGVSNAIIHHQNTSHEQLSSLYWLNIAVGISLFLLVSIASPWISLFYDEPRLTELLIILSLSFIILAIGNQYRILFQKDLQFNLMAKIEIVAAAGAFVVAVVCAIAGFGVYSLVNATLASTIIASALYLFFGISTHRPSFIFRYDETKKYLGFGMYQTGQSTLNYFNSQFDVILIGKLLGAEALGIYSLVKQLAMRPAQIINPIITKVTFPILAKFQNDTDALKGVYLKTINYISSVNFPIYMLIAVLAEPIVIIMFGEEWRKAAPVLQILAVYFMIRSIGNPIGSLVMATGKVHREFWWNVGMFAVFPVSIYIGSFWQLEGVAISLTILMLLALVPMWFFMVKPLCNAKFTEYFKQILIPASIAVLAGILSYFVVNITESLLVKLIFGSMVGLLMVGMLNFVWNKKFLVELRGMVRR